MVVYDIQILYPIPTYVNTTKINPLYKTLFWTFVSETAILAINGTILEHEYLFMQPVADRGIFKKSKNLEKKKLLWGAKWDTVWGSENKGRPKVAVRTARSVSENKELLSAL